MKTEPRDAPVFPAPVVPMVHSTPMAEPPQAQHQIVEQDLSAEQYGDEGGLGESVLTGHGAGAEARAAAAPWGPAAAPGTGVAGRKCLDLMYPTT